MENSDKKKKKVGRYKKVKDKQEMMIESRNSIYSELREVRWLYDPVVYSQLSGDFSLMQQRILIGIIEKLQQRIIDSVEAQHKSKSFPDIFEESELMGKETIELKLSASELGIIPEHYDQLDQAAKVLSKITMKYPKFNIRGEVSRMVYAALFPKIEIAKTESELRRTGMLRVVMLTENIREIFSMSQGYIRHVSHIALIAQKKRTPRMYIYLSRFKDVGHKRVPYADLIEYLGLTDEYYYETNKGENPYTSWAKVKQLVLDPVKKEMDELARAGEINFSFDYKPIYPKGKSRGIPNDILFTLKNSEMGEIRTMQEYRANSVRKFIEAYLNWCPDFSLFDLGEITNSLSDELLQEFINFALVDVRTIVERKQPDNVASYAMGILKRWKSEHVQPVLFEEIKESEEVINERLREIREKWLQALGMKDYTMYLSQVELKIIDGELRILCPHPQVTEKVEEWRELLERESGMKINIVG